MTKVELHAKQPSIVKPEGQQFLRDIAAHMRMAAPAQPGTPNDPAQQFDTTHIIRRSGWLDGWLTACNYLHVVAIPDPAPGAPAPKENYVAPASAKADEQKPVPPPNMPDFLKPVGNNQ